MPSVYDLKIRARLDDSDVKNKLKGLGAGGGGAPAPGGGSGTSRNVERAALAVNAAALARSLNILGREFDEIGKNLGNANLAKGISEFSRTMSNVTMLGRSLGGFGVALGLATTAVKLWSETVGRARGIIGTGMEAAAEIARGKEEREKMDAYRNMSESERNNARYQLTQQKSQYEDKAADIAQKLAAYGGNYDEYKRTIDGIIDGQFDNSMLEGLFDKIAKQGGAIPEDFLGNLGRYKDMLEFARDEVSRIDATLAGYDRVDAEKDREAPAWDDIAPEIRYAAQRGNDLGGGLASVGGSLVGVSTMESQLKELQEIRTLVGYMRNVMMEQGAVALYD